VSRGNRERGHFLSPAAGNHVVPVSLHFSNATDRPRVTTQSRGLQKGSSRFSSRQHSGALLPDTLARVTRGCRFWCRGHGRAVSDVSRQRHRGRNYISQASTLPSRCSAQDLFVRPSARSGAERWLSDKEHCQRARTRVWSLPIKRELCRPNESESPGRRQGLDPDWRSANRNRLWPAANQRD
jgi:hypothetical protein